MRGLVEVPSLRLAAVTTPHPRLFIPFPGFVAPKRGLVVPSWRLVAPCTRVVHGHRLGARLVLESLRVVARLELAPARRPRHAAAAIAGAGAWTTGPAVVAAAVAVLALAAVWPPLPGVLSSAIFVIVTVAVLLAPPPVHLVTAVAVAGGRGGGLYYEPALAPSRYFTRPLYATRRGGSVGRDGWRSTAGWRTS